MNRRTILALASAVAGLALFGSAIAAEPAKPRFTIDSSRDGFVRLDTQTGAVTHCAPANGKWTCDGILPPADAAIAARVDALSVKLAALATESAALETSVNQLARNAVRSAGAAAEMPANQSMAQSSRTPGVADRIVGRFLAMVRLLKHGKNDAKAVPTPS